jgi:hypothetical protein
MSETPMQPQSPSQHRPHQRPLSPQAARRGRRTLLLIALITVAPVIASYAAYYLFPRDKQANYGELLATAPPPELTGTAADGTPFRLADLKGQWVLVVAGSAGCDDACAHALYATRQARTIQGREQERISRLLLLTDAGVPNTSLLAQHPGLVVAHAPASALASWPAGSDRIFVLDPLGNLILAFPRAPDIKGLARDLTRLLKASRIG